MNRPKKISRQKKSGKIFSGPKKGVSLPAAVRIIIRAADVQLTPDFFHRSEFPAAIPHFRKMAGSPGSTQFLCPHKKIGILFSGRKNDPAPHQHFIWFLIRGLQDHRP
jgi:hypothetical protein